MLLFSLKQNETNRIHHTLFFRKNFRIKKSIEVTTPYLSSTIISQGWLGKTVFNESRGGSRIFSRGERIFKKFSKILTTFFFLGRSDWFSELSQSSKKTLFWPNFLRRRQFFEKTGQKSRFWALFGKFWQKKRVFWRALPLKTSIYWRRRRL